jgi:subtilisin family serine protease
LRTLKVCVRPTSMKKSILFLILNFISNISYAFTSPLLMIKQREATAFIDRTGFITTTVIVAVIDSGLAAFHPDMQGKILINHNEQSLPIGDWDGNGYKNDVLGYDFVDASPAIIDTNGHGTHVAGIILAVNPKVKILPIRVLDKEGRGNSKNTMEAIKYAVNRGAKIINLSLGALDALHGTKNAYEEAIRLARSQNVLIVAAAGNNNSDNDQFAFYPSNIWEDNLISVCSVGSNYLKSSFSNYGKRKVHLCAPGDNILSANYNYQDGLVQVMHSGTSQAAPFVAGAASLLLSINPSLKPFQLRNILMESVSKYPTLLSGVSQTQGILNLESAIKMAFAPPEYSLKEKN